MAKSKSQKRIPQQKRSEKTRNKIIDAGIRLFSAEGYYNTSSKKIAREAGVAVGSFYNYFTDKKELLFEIQRLHSERVHGMVAENLAESDLSDPATGGLALVRKIVMQAMAMHEYSPELHREITALKYSDPDFAVMVDKQKVAADNMFITILEPHKKNIRVKDITAASMVIGHSIEAVVHSIKMFGSPIKKERLLDALSDMIYRFLYKDS